MSQEKPIKKNQLRKKEQWSRRQNRMRMPVSMISGTGRTPLSLVQRLLAVGLAVLLTVFPCISPPGGMQAQAAGFRIERVARENMLADVKFEFYGGPISSGIYYWIKSDGSPLICVQKKAQLTNGLQAVEDSEEFKKGTHFTRMQYELTSIVLQCCGMKWGETESLEPGAYLAAQAAVWGILSGSWTGTAKLRETMDTLHEHVADWNGISSQVLVEQSEAMTELICGAIDDYYGDSSAYVPAFASKYEDCAPVWQVQWQEDDSCQVVFSLEDRAEAVKEFEFQLPDGWSYEWVGDQVTFTCQDPQPGVIAVTGTAPEDSELGTAMPIGLIYIVMCRDYPSLQHLASGVEITAPWSCYFKIAVPEKPEDPGSWYLPEVSYYRHQEDFAALYGIELEKTDGDTGEPLADAAFQVMEYFDAGQLDGTVLEASQIDCWDGWKVRCETGMTDENGKLQHWDQKKYHYEKTYCGGHPDPEITYEGHSEPMQARLEEEAWEAWEAEVVACQSRCDYHAVDGSGARLLEADRDLAYQQFINLAYGYTFQELQPPQGYLPHGESPKDQPIERIFSVSIQAGGQCREEGNRLEQSIHSVDPVKAEMKTAGKAREDLISSVPASGSDAGRKEDQEDHRLAAGKQGTSSTASRSTAVRRSRKRLGKRNLVWLTSMVKPLEQEEMETASFYCFHIENHKPGTPPEETTPEETTPEETTPEETTPEETPPEETTPEETPPEETTPEESNPEVPPTEPPSHHSGGGGGKDPAPPKNPPAVIPTVEPVPRIGWVQAEYVPDRIADQTAARPGDRESEMEQDGSGNNSLPKTGERGPGAAVFLALMLIAGAGLAGLGVLRRRKVTGSRKLWGCFLVLLCLSAAGPGTMTARAESASEIVLVIPRDREEGCGQIPEASYQDEEGQEYVLDFYRQTESVLPEEEEWISVTRSYCGLEGRGQIPKLLPMEAEHEEDGRIGSGQLQQADVEQTGQYWSENFAVPITFYDYGADQYTFQDITIPKGQELQWVLEHSASLLEAVGCSTDQYEILAVAWNGEAYPNQGILCRDALASGRKLVYDYQVGYEGMIRYPEAIRPFWEAVYRPAVLEEEPSAEETAQSIGEARPVTVTPEAASESEEEELPPVQEETAGADLRWKKIRTIAVYTISLAVFIPLVLFLAAWYRKKHSAARRKEELQHKV